MDEQLRERFSVNLKNALERNKRTQKELADYLGVSTATVSDWVNGKKIPRTDKLARYVNTTKKRGQCFLTSPFISALFHHLSQGFFDDRLLRLICKPVQNVLVRVDVQLQMELNRIRRIVLCLRSYLCFCLCHVLPPFMRPVVAVNTAPYYSAAVPCTPSR